MRAYMHGSGKRNSSSNALKSQNVRDTKNNEEKSKAPKRQSASQTSKKGK